MKVSANKNFEPCPEYSGRAVCVDVTPLERKPSKFGDRDVFRLVFEIDMERENGERWVVWSGQMTPTLNEKANLRKFIKGWFGRDLTADELKDFDTESLIGRPAYVVVIHEHKDNETYANIGIITPHKNSEGQPLAPSGKFVRRQDRQDKGAGSGQAAAAGAGGGDYRRFSPPAEQLDDWTRTKVHVGKYSGQEIRDLPPEAVIALQEKWLPEAMKKERLTADDTRLKKALEEYHKKQNPPLQDDLQY